MVKRKIVKKSGEIKNNLEIESYSWTGAKVKNLTVSSPVFSQEQNDNLLAQALRVYQFNLRQGRANTKTRGEVRGGGKKPWKQKGTGRARQGSTRAPHWKGGGVVFGPKPRDFDLKLPKEMKKKALWVALSMKLKKQEIVTVQVEKANNYKTHAANILLGKLLETKKGLKNALFIYTEEDKNVIRALRNLDYINTINVRQLNAYEVSMSQLLIYTENAIKTYEK